MSTEATTKSDLLKLHSKMQDIPLRLMRVSNAAQRDLRPARVDFLVSNFDPEDFGNPVVNLRDKHAYIIDGQHRIEAVKRFIGDGWESQSVTCRVYTGMTEQQEAQMFDRLNNQLTVSVFDKFKVRVTAGSSDEIAVKKIVESVGLHIAKDRKSEGAIGSVGTLLKIYRRADGSTLKRSLRIVHTAFGDPGLTNSILDGVALLCERYNGALDDKKAVDKLHDMRGGVGALIVKANNLRKQTGQSAPVCVAAATVDVINGGAKGGRKLPSWWKE